MVKGFTTTSCGSEKHSKHAGVGIYFIKTSVFFGDANKVFSNGCENKKKLKKFLTLKNDFFVLTPHI
jgi:hypothetical protein